MRVMLRNVYSGVKGNSNYRGKVIVGAYYFIHPLRKQMSQSQICFFIFLPFLLLYKILVDWVMGCEIPASTKIGPGLVIHHGRNIILNKNTVLGSNVVLKHNVTLGGKENKLGVDMGCPVIGDNVIISPHCILIGPIRVGNNATIGAGSVVVKDVPESSVVAGNPAREIKKFTRVNFENKNTK